MQQLEGTIKETLSRCRKDRRLRLNTQDLSLIVMATVDGR
jgi:hypothetical protein